MQCRRNHIDLCLCCIFVVDCRFKDFDGEMLMEYQQMRRESPKTFDACVQREVTAGRLAMADVSKLIHELNLL